MEISNANATIRTDSTPVPSPAAAPENAKAGRLLYIDGFRATAIVLLVASHCLWLAWEGRELPFAGQAVVNILSGATALFLFISGLLIAYLNPLKKGVTAFLASKSRNVVIPALFWISLVSAMLLTINIEWLEAYYPAAPGDTAVSRAMTAIKFAVSHTALWYIPFIALVFLLTPSLLKFMAGPLWRAQFCVGGELGGWPHD